MQFYNINAAKALVEAMENRKEIPKSKRRLIDADKVAKNGYEISLKRFQNGKISITDLDRSLSERESAKRD